MTAVVVPDHALTEIWRPVVGWEGRYEVSNLGDVRGIGPHGQGRMKPYSAGPHDYRRIALYIGGPPGKRSKTKNVHELVAAAFIGPRPPGMFVCHNDGSRTNDRADNLRYDTPKANQADRIKHGTANFGERNPSAVMSDEQVICIRKVRFENGVSIRSLACLTGLSLTGVQRILATVKRR